MLTLAGLLTVGCDRQGASPASSQPARRVVAVAAAANLKFAFDKIAAAFLREHPDVQLKVTYGSSGNFYAQLSNKAPFDVFLSADTEYPRRLIGRSLASKDSEFLYAVGRLVVWAPGGSPLDIEALGMQALLDPAVKKIAIANPRHAPYGRAAEAAMKSLGLYEQVKERLVLGENVAQTAQFAQSGAADVAIIPASLAMDPGMQGRSWDVPLSAHPRMEQAGIILNGAQDPEAAKELRAYIMGPAGQAILKRHGYHTAGE